MRSISSRTVFRISGPVLAMTLAATLAACAANPPAPTAVYPGGSTQGNWVEYGYVRQIEYAPASGGSGPNVGGAILGGVAGAVIGNQVSRHTGGGSRDAATVLGGVAGAAIGSQVGRSAPAGNASVYRVTIQTDNGGLRTIDVSATGDLRAGDRVRIENGVIYRM